MVVTENALKKKFEYYRKWLDSLKMKEFFNLPVKDQNRTLALFEKFLDDCKRINSEAKEIQEKAVLIRVINAVEDQGKLLIKGHIEGAENTIDVIMDKETGMKEGSTFNCVLFSIDGDMWFSSKEELITGRRR
jgi:hypothetical protein